MTNWLQRYSVPVVLAVLLHAFFAVSPAAFGFGTTSKENEFIFEPNAVSASLVILERVQTASEVVPPVPDVSGPVVPIAMPEPADDPVDTEVEPVQTEEDLEALKQLRLQELRDSIFDNELRREGDELAAQDMEDEGTTYVNAIYSAVVVKWTRPPSATRTMEAVVKVELFPNGELNSASLVKSSGNDAFDRSTLAAVKSVERFSGSRKFSTL